MYVTRLIDTYLTHWAKQSNRKPLLLRRARQVGKSSAIRCSLENFGHLNYVDTYENNVVRQVSILPLYAIANIFEVKA